MSAPLRSDADRFAGPWFDAKTAALYIPCKTVKAWYQWRDRHGIVTRANGSVAKADLDRALRVKKPTKRGLHPNSQRNLLKSTTRRAAAPTADVA